MKFIALLFLGLSLNLYSGIKENKNKNSKDSISTVKFSIVGDLMCHSPQFEYARTDSGFDFSSNYRYIKSFLRKSDFVIGNLETVLAGENRRYSGYPLFNTPDEFILALKEAGFNLLTTSNNHSLDKHKKGLIRTIDKIREKGFYHSGTYKSQQERDSIEVIKINSITFTILSYSYGTNGIPVPKGEEYLVNIINEELIKADIKQAKNQNIDLILVYYHFGDEYQSEPSEYQQDIVKKTIEYGADIILGGHPHVVQPVEFYKTNNGNLDTGFVAYSLGNFISNQRWRYSDGGPVLNFSVTKNLSNDSIYIEQLEIVPTWVFKGETECGKKYIIVPSDSIDSFYRYPFLTELDKKKIKQSYRDVVEIMSSRSDKIKFYSPASELKRLFIKPKPVYKLPPPKSTRFELVIY